MTTTEESTDSKTQVIEYGVTEAALAKLAEKNALITAVDADNYPELKKNATELQKLRKKVDDRRKELTSDALEWQRKVNEKAAEITAAIVKIEEPVKKLKSEYDDALKAVAEEAERKERERTDEINGRIDAIENAGKDLDGLNAEQLRKRKEAIAELLPTEEKFAEFTAVALERHESTIARLIVAHGKAVARELEAQQLKEEQDKLAKDKADAAAAQKLIDDANAAAAKKLADDRAAFEAEKQAAAEKENAAAREKREAEEKIARDARDKEIADKAAADALAAKQAADEAERVAKAERAALAPDRDKLIVYANQLEAFMESAPELTNDKAMKVLARCMTSLKQTRESLIDTAGRL